MPHHSERETKMKTRQGFVSNSSTSSFFVVMKKDQFDKAVEKSDITKDDAEECVMGGGHFLGHDVVIAGNLYTQDDILYEWSEGQFEFYGVLEMEPDILKGSIGSG